MLAIFMSCKSQIVNELTYDSLKIKLVDFLQNQNEIDSLRAEKLKSGEHTFNLRGLFNNRMDKKLINGVYAFSSLSSNSKAYFVIIESNSFTILDLSTRVGLDKAIKDVLDFSERSKYCVAISSEIVSRLVTVYYNINKNPLNRSDINCYKGVINTDDLP